MVYANPERKGFQLLAAHDGGHRIWYILVYFILLVAAKPQRTALNVPPAIRFHHASIA